MKSKLYITTSEDYIDKSKMIIKKENGDYIKQEGSYIFFEDNLGKTKKSSGNIQNIITNLYYINKNRQQEKFNKNNK